MPIKRPDIRLGRAQHVPALTIRRFVHEGVRLRQMADPHRMPQLVRQNELELAGALEPENGYVALPALEPESPHLDELPERLEVGVVLFDQLIQIGLSLLELIFDASQALHLQVQRRLARFELDSLPFEIGAVLSEPRELVARCAPAPIPALDHLIVLSEKPVEVVGLTFELFLLRDELFDALLVAFDGTVEGDLRLVEVPAGKDFELTLVIGEIDRELTLWVKDE